MRQAIKLIRDDEPMELDDLNDGDEVSYEYATGNVLRIVDKDGNEKWKAAREPQGRVGHMRAVRAAKQ